MVLIVLKVLVKLVVRVELVLVFVTPVEVVLVVAVVECVVVDTSEKTSRQGSEENSYSLPQLTYASLLVTYFRN